ncbi:MAG: hypothetical protein AB1512_17470 [Thermodesulfobacteriota bacterium]
MEQLELIHWLIDRLEKAGLRYFVTGSIASSYYGIPRYTHDIDIVVAIGRGDTDTLIRLLGGKGYISKEGIQEALSGSGMFNFIHSQTGLKVDFWVDRGEAFTRSCFERAVKVEVSEGVWAVLGSQEDVFLHKVYWDRLTPSERQIGDALGILAVQGRRLDRAYLMKWAKILKIERKVKAMLAEKTPPNMEVLP